MQDLFIVDNTWTISITAFAPHDGILAHPDRQPDRQKAMHMSPPCISTVVLKKIYVVTASLVLLIVRIKWLQKIIPSLMILLKRSSIPRIKKYK